MSNGLFSQCVCLLTGGMTRLADVTDAFKNAAFEIAKEVPPQGDWRFSGPSLVVPFRPEVNGYVAVDVVDRPWPDAMGDPKSDAQTFAAWSMGQFGPYTFPGSLLRAGEHSWAWEGGRAVAQEHRGFIRLRLSYCFGVDDNAPLLPANYDPLAELSFLSEAVLAIFPIPGVLCYFNPNGEVLRDRIGFEEIWLACQAQQNIPLPLWSNMRFFNLNPNLGLMDTVGNSQLDLWDVQAVFPTALYSPQRVDYYLRNVTHYLMGLDRELTSGEAIDGPGDSNASWITEVAEDAITQPPRQVLRLYPKTGQKQMASALAKATR